MAIEAGVTVEHCTCHTNVFHCVFLWFVVEQPEKATAKAVRNHEKQYLQSRCERRWYTDEEKYRNVVLHAEGCSSNSKSLRQRLNEKEDPMLTEKMKEKSALWMGVVMY